MITFPSTVEDWQALIDEHFPQGVQINYRDTTGLVDPTYSVPYLAVMEVDAASQPFLKGYHLDSSWDFEATLTSWEDQDRDGHYIARVQTTEGRTAELSSWLSDRQVSDMGQLREQQKAWLIEQRGVSLDGL